MIRYVFWGALWLILGGVLCVGLELLTGGTHWGFAALYYACGTVFFAGFDAITDYAIRKGRK